MNIHESNKLIAEFMGAEPIKRYDPEGWWKIPNGNLPHGYEVVMLARMKYNHSWDWLMPVVEKINAGTIAGYPEIRIGKRVEIFCFDTHKQKGKYFKPQENCLIESVYKGITQLIQWCNENK